MRTVTQVVQWIPVHIATQAVTEIPDSSFDISPRHTSPLPPPLHQRSTPPPSIPLSHWTTELEDSKLTLLRHVQLAQDPTAIDAVVTHIFNLAQIATDEARFASPTLGGGVNALGIEDVKL